MFSWDKVVNNCVVREHKNIYPLKTHCCDENFINIKRFNSSHRSGDNNQSSDLIVMESVLIDGRKRKTFMLLFKHNNPGYFA
jgi:hypothetical protein